MVDINDIKARLSKDTLTKFKIGSEISKDYIPTPSLGLNMTIDGWGIGKQSTLWGNESAGKSALAIQSLAIAQLQDRGVGYFDAEKTFDPEWATRLGADTDQMFVSQVSSIGEYADISNDWIKAGVEFIVLDSTSALMPKSFFQDDGELKAFENTGQIGQFARELGQAGRMIQGQNFSAAMLNISQVRMDLAGFKPSMKASGGKEVGHADSLRIKVFSGKGDNFDIKGKIYYGDNLVEERTGRKVTWTVDKNKVNGHYGTNTYNLMFRGDRVGVDKNSELLEFGKKFGIIEGSGWLKFYGENINGKDKFLDFMVENPHIADKLEQDILAQSIQ